MGREIVVKKGNIRFFWVFPIILLIRSFLSARRRPPFSTVRDIDNTAG
jgi:hypothetical protein